MSTPGATGGAVPHADVGVLDIRLSARTSDSYSIGAVAIREGLEVLHADADFETLARHTDLHTHHTG